MDINLTNDQYEKLIKVVYLGMWIADINGKNADPLSEIEQLVYSHSREIPDQKLLEYDQVDHKYYPSEKFDKDDTIAELIEHYEETCFWDELIDRLTKRDMVKKYGLDKIHHMTQEEVFEKEKEFIEKYESVFQQSGLDRLEIK